MSSTRDAGALAACVLVACIMAGGCDQAPYADEFEPTPAERSPSPWKKDGNAESAKIALDKDGDDGLVNDPELDAAIAEARATADEARERWAKAAESLRSRWAVKWAAETSEGGVEYLWVQPVHWSPFRVEGRLANEPVNDLALASQPVVGDLVTFPIEEFADWVHYLEGDVDGPREGGFTIDVLEARYGRPGE